MLSLATVCMLYLAKVILAHQERVIYVLPEDQPLTHCPEEENCYRLTELINLDLLSGQTSNTTIALLPGTHTCTSAVNKTLSISNATNFALIAANSSAGATIKCNGSIGFKFSFITNLTITDVVFTECGSYQTCDFFTQKRIPRTITFTLFLNYSTNANISNVTITDGNRIGLILMNPQVQTTLTHSYISHNNHGNIYIFSMDSKSIALSDTMIAIISSNFTASAKGIRIRYNPCFPMSERPFGVQFVLQHSRYHIHVKLMNISVVQNEVNLDLKYTSFKTTMNINSLKSVGKRIFVKNQNITLRNIIIPGTLNGILIHDNSVVNIEGTFAFLRNRKEFMTQKHTNVTVHKNSNFIFRHNNINNGESPFVITDSNIWFLTNSLISFVNNTGTQSGGITFVNTKVVFKGGSILLFTGNRGKRGGAIAFYAQSHVLFNGGITNLTLRIIMPA